MNNLTSIRVTAPPETVIKKLSKANIALYNLKKEGATTTFAVKDKTVKKVFAIFTHPCYNICVVKYGGVRSFAVRVLSRIGAAVGCLIFAAAVLTAQSFVFSVQVGGSGSYLAPQVIAILGEYGVEEGRLYRGVDKPVVISRIMSLPSVTFCSLEKRGTAFIVDVECSPEGTKVSLQTPLLSPVTGTVQSVVAICGTPRVEEGQAVSRGDELISPRYTAADGSVQSCLCVGYARILVVASVTSHAEEESEQSLSAALAAVNLYSQEASVTSYSVKHASDGVIYTVNFTYIYTASINMQ